MAILHRKDQQDYITLYCCIAWSVILRMDPPPEGNTNLEGIAWCPMIEDFSENRPPLIAWESPTFSGRIFVFGSEGGSCKVISLAGENVEWTCGYEQLVWYPNCGWVAALIKDAYSFTIWNAISNKLGATISVGPLHISPGETVTIAFHIWSIQGLCRWCSRK